MSARVVSLALQSTLVLPGTDLVDGRNESERRLRVHGSNTLRGFGGGKP